jgi:hypothetical protein
MNKKYERFIEPSNGIQIISTGDGRTVEDAQKEIDEQPKKEKDNETTAE